MHDDEADWADAPKYDIDVWGVAWGIALIALVGVLLWAMMT